jgi:hypothetical protein
MLRMTPPRYRHSSPRSTHTPNKLSMKQCCRRHTRNSKPMGQNNKGNTTPNSSRRRNSRLRSCKLPSNPRSCHRRLHLVRITPSHQTTSLRSRPRRLSQPRNYPNSAPLYQARGLRPPSCRAAPCRVRPSRRARLLSRRARPSPPVPMPCQPSWPLRAQVVLILLGTSGRSDTVAPRLVGPHNVRALLLDMLRPRHT